MGKVKWLGENGPVDW